LFLSQRPYLPQGNLLTALYYPDTTENVDLAKITRILERVQLAHLQDRLEQEQDWSRILSLGEQQRLAFARLLLHKPKVAFLDEASASLDEGMEHAMYRLIREELPTTTIILKINMSSSKTIKPLKFRKSVLSLIQKRMLFCYNLKILLN